MGLLARVSKIVAFLRAGYPTGIPETGCVPLLALLPRRVSDDEISLITRELVARRRRPIDTADVGVEITRTTHQMPSPEDIERIQHRFDEIGWSGIQSKRESDRFDSAPKRTQSGQPPTS